MVETVANNQGVKGLKFKNKHGIMVHPADWLAGVDYTEENSDYN